MTTINATKVQIPVIELDPLCIFAKALLLPETKDTLMQGSSSGGKRYDLNHKGPIAVFTKSGFRSFVALIPSVEFKPEKAIWKLQQTTP